jgi:hypothetical protein
MSLRFLICLVIHFYYILQKPITDNLRSTNPYSYLSPSGEVCGVGKERLVEQELDKEFSYVEK